MESILTVTAAAPSFDLTTIADVKGDLGISGTASDTLLQRYVTECSLQLAQACKRVFAKETVSELIRPDQPPAKLVLRRWPVVTVTSITEDGAVSPLAVADFEVEKDAGLVFRLSGDKRTPWTAEKIVAVYEAGWVVPGAAPKDLQKAVRAMVASQWLSKGRDPLVRSESVPGVYEAAYWVGALPGGASLMDAIEGALNAYREAGAR